MYQALYRKWRPRNFDEVVGQPHVTETLRRQVQSGRTSHAYLFTGTRGTGKTTCAKILARALNCAHPVDGNPCNSCPACLSIASGANPDVEELDAASNNGVDNVRALREEAVYTPATVKKRVYIIDEVHMLSGSAFNALLKIMEEPPEHLVFILATTELRKVPATILSRCQRFAFKRLSPALIRGRLDYVAAQEGLALQPEASALLSHLADGSMRDALSLLDQCAGAGSPIDRQLVEDCIGLAGADQTGRLLQDLAAGDAGSALLLLDNLYNNGRDPGSVLNELSILLRDILIARLAPKSGEGLLSGSYTPATLEALGAGLEQGLLLDWTGKLRQAIFEMNRSEDRRLQAELCLMAICSPSQTAPGRPAQSPAATQSTAQAGKTPPVKAAAPAAKQPAAQPSPPAEDRPPWEAPPAEAEAPSTDVGTAAESSPAADTRPAKTAPAEAPAAPAASSDLLDWQSLVADLRDHLDMMPYIFLSQASGEIGPEGLVIHTGDPAARNILDTRPVREAIQARATALLGRPVNVRVVQGAAKSPAVQAPPQGEDPLDRLAKFEGTVKFK